MPIKGCGCTKKCVACSGFKPLHAAYKEARLRLGDERQRTLDSPFVQRLIDWAEEDPRNAVTVEKVLDQLGLRPV